MPTRTQLTSLTAGAALLLCLGAPAQASYLTSILTSGVENLFEDQSREAYFDTNGDGIFGLGDVLTGFVRIDDKTGPNAVTINNQLYAIFSQEIVAVDPSPTPIWVEFGAVTSDPSLSLASLGVAGAQASDIIAVYSNLVPYSTNLIDASPGDRTGDGTVTLADYLDVIINDPGSVLDITMGIQDTPTCTGAAGSDADCFQGTSLSGLINGPNATLVGLGAGVTIANFVAGLSSSLDPAGFVLQDAVQAGTFAPPAPLVVISEVSVSNGAARGTSGVVNAAEWIDGSELTANSIQCTTAGGLATCGFANDADFGILPVAVPEPTTLSLLGAGLLGMGAIRRRQRRRQS